MKEILQMKNQMWIFPSQEQLQSSPSQQQKGRICNNLLAVHSLLATNGLQFSSDGNTRSGLGGNVNRLKQSSEDQMCSGV